MISLIQKQKCIIIFGQILEIPVIVQCTVLLTQHVLGSSICMPESDMLLVCKLTSLSALIDVRVCTAEHKYWVNRNRICSYCSQTVDYHSDTHLHTSFKICIVIVLENYLKKGYLSPVAVMSSMNQGQILTCILPKIKKEIK